MSQHIFPGGAKIFSRGASPPCGPLVTGLLTYPGTSWYVVTVRDPQLVRDHKKFWNYWCKVITPTGNALDFRSRTVRRRSRTVRLQRMFAS